MGVFDEAKHFRGYHGRWAKGVGREKGSHSPNAFAPRPSVAKARARKELLPSRVREVRSLYARRDRGEQLSGRDRQKISWASPKKMLEQQAKTGDSYVPRDELLSRERSFARHERSPRASRTGVKRTFSGKRVAVRGGYRDTTAGGVSHRVRRVS